MGKLSVLCREQEQIRNLRGGVGGEGGGGRGEGGGRGSRN